MRRHSGRSPRPAGWWPMRTSWEAARSPLPATRMHSAASPALTNSPFPTPTSLPCSVSLVAFDSHPEMGTLLAVGTAQGLKFYPKEVQSESLLKPGSIEVLVVGGLDLGRQGKMHTSCQQKTASSPLVGRHHRTADTTALPPAPLPLPPHPAPTRRSPHCSQTAMCGYTGSWTMGSAWSWCTRPRWRACPAPSPPSRAACWWEWTPTCACTTWVSRGSCPATPWEAPWGP